MRRFDAIRVIVDCLGDEFVVACNGMINRELFAIGDRERNFYMLGSMGLASAIGLGVALAKPDSKVVVLAGDGNVLMSLGTLATIGKASPRNLVHVVLDNECHESTGGQETATSVAKLDVVAGACGFRCSERVDSLESLKRVLVASLSLDGSSFIHVKVERGRADVPRVSIDPLEMRDRFMKELASV
ncbi:sulfopyruvate decarboxylase subunit beta [Candidatus Bathyarchaeota archaeon]|nr:MAG: sulfopyruvate decarboxylase subunit beta [Candidatus Bathyarchaeota archaeon]